MEVASDQLITWCCIDRLSWHALPDMCPDPRICDWHQNHLFLAAVQRRASAQAGQELTGESAERFLADCWAARRTVPSPMPKVSPIFAQESPAPRKEAILFESTTTRGRPRRFPLALADASPDRTRSRISSRSNSAIEAKMPKISRPFAVDVSTPSCRLMKSMPKVRKLLQRIYELA